ncbi:MAG: hypothetical protein R2845_00625 [Thermomicrobiales bacterium]
MPEPADQRKRRRWPWLLALLFVLVLWWPARPPDFPQATVTLTRQRTPITTEVPIVVTEAGGEAARTGDCDRGTTSIG